MTSTERELHVESDRRIRVYYCPKMDAESCHEVSQSSSKPGNFVAALRSQHYPVSIQKPNPVCREDLYRAHSPQYVDDVLALQTENGFGNTSKQIAKTLLWTSGSLFSACIAALEDGLAHSPTSGFHHAHYELARSFCTFNGLMVSTLKLLRESHVERVAIVDCDYHRGNGTKDIIRRSKTRSTEVFHASLGYEYRTVDKAALYLARMRELEHDFSVFLPDIIIYQAGVDTHIQDPLGGLLTSEQILERDGIMFEIARRMGIPIAWNLAGGYQTIGESDPQPVLDLHFLGFKAACEAFSL